MQAIALLCDYAQVHAGKLYVVGAGINLIGTPAVAPPHPISIAVGVAVTIPWNAHNQPHKLVISLVSEDGEVVPFTETPPGSDISEGDRGRVIAQFNAGRSHMLQPGDPTVMPLAVPLNVRLPALGGYSVTVEIDGTELARAQFRVLHTTEVVGK